jgi:hypothetical protein
VVLCLDLVSIPLSNILGGLIKPWLEFILLGERLFSPSILKLLGFKVDPIGIKLLVVFLNFRNLLLSQEEISKFIEIPVLVVVDFKETLILSAESSRLSECPTDSQKEDSQVIESHMAA